MVFVHLVPLMSGIRSFFELSNLTGESPKAS